MTDRAACLAAVFVVGAIIIVAITIASWATLLVSLAASAGTSLLVLKWRP